TKTLINSGSTFQYSFTFPINEPPGLYWYHPHVHGLAERDILGGASGALIVDGMQNVQPAVAGLRERVLVIRDQPQVQGAAEGPGNCGVGVPFQDLSVNYVPVDSNLRPDGSVTFTPADLRFRELNRGFHYQPSDDLIADRSRERSGIPIESAVGWKQIG